MADLTILGAGIFGLSVAWRCQQKGMAVRVIDPNGPGGGASGGLVGALAPHVPENWNEKKAFQLDSLLMAQTFWDEIEAAAGRSSGYARTGRVQPIADAHALLLAKEREVTAKDLWGDHASWQVVSADAIPISLPSQTGMYTFDTLSARLHPRQACLALARAIAVRGGEIVTKGVEEGRVLHATGASGFEALNRAAGRVVGTGVKGQAALLNFAAPNVPQVFVDGLHIIFHADGTTAVGSTSETDFVQADGTDNQLDDVLNRAYRAFPALVGAPVIERWAGLRPRAKSRAPMLGVHPLYPDQFVANGGFKIGFGMAPKIANVMADLILDGKDQVPEAFRPEASLPSE